MKVRSLTKKTFLQLSVLIAGTLGAFFFSYASEREADPIVVEEVTPHILPMTGAPGEAPSSATGTAFVLPQATKVEGCVAKDGMPDSACTPGAVFAATAAQVCRKGYSAVVRKVSEKTKRKVYAAYGITKHPRGKYEVDHLISLELGGSNDVANLWPEASAPRPGFHEKDVVENWLHRQVCKGAMTLEAAQRQVITDWRTVYRGLKASDARGAKCSEGCS